MFSGRFGALTHSEVTAILPDRSAQTRVQLRKLRRVPRVGTNRSRDRSARALPPFGARDDESRARRGSRPPRGPASKRFRNRNATQRSATTDTAILTRAFPKTHTSRSTAELGWRRPQGTRPTKTAEPAGTGFGVPPRHPLIPTPRVGRSPAILLPLRRSPAHGVELRLSSLRPRPSASTPTFAPSRQGISGTPHRRTLGGSRHAVSFVSQEGL